MQITQFVVDLVIVYYATFQLFGFRTSPRLSSSSSSHPSPNNRRPNKVPMAPDRQNRLRGIKGRSRLWMRSPLVLPLFVHRILHPDLSHPIQKARLARCKG